MCRNLANLGTLNFQNSEMVIVSECHFGHFSVLKNFHGSNPNSYPPYIGHLYRYIQKAPQALEGKAAPTGPS